MFFAAAPYKLFIDSVREQCGDMATARILHAGAIVGAIREGHVWGPRKTVFFEVRFSEKSIPINLAISRSILANVWKFLLSSVNSSHYLGFRET